MSHVRTEDEVCGWLHRLNGHEFEQAPEDGDGQGSLACCSPRGRKESDRTEQLNNNARSGCHMGADPLTDTSALCRLPRCHLPQEAFLDLPPSP